MIFMMMIQMIFIFTLFMVRYHLGLKIMRKQKKRFQLDIRYFLDHLAYRNIIFRLSETGTIVNLTWFQCSEHSQWNEVKGLDGQFHINPLYFVTPGITKTKIDLIIIFLLREKIDLKTSFSTPSICPRPHEPRLLFRDSVLACEKYIITTKK